jgi:glutathione S-transferase
MDPVQYPTVSIDDKQYQLKFRKSDIVRLQHEGVDLLDPVGFQDRSQTLWMLSHMIAAGIAHAAPFTWEEITDKMDWGDLAAASKAVAEALGKVLAQVNGELAAKSRQVQ